MDTHIYIYIYIYLPISREGVPGPLRFAFWIAVFIRGAGPEVGASVRGLRSCPGATCRPKDDPRPPPRPQDPFKTANKGPKIANIGPKSGPRPAT